MALQPFNGELDEVAPSADLKPFTGTLDDPKRTVGGTLKDTGISLLKGAISVPEAAVGIADLATGGAAGRAAEGLGFRPKEAKAILDEGYSDAQKAANAKVSNAEGFFDTVKTAAQNPSTILQAGIESLPLIGGGGVVGMGARALKASPVIAGAIGEGVVGAGMAAEGTRQQTDDGLLTGKQAGLSALSGVGTAALGAAGGKVAQKLGIADIDTLAAGGAQASADGLLKRSVKGALSEGIEETPQSVQEQVLQNAALDRPLTEGVDNAAAMGLLTGSAMGGGVSAISGGGKDKLIVSQGDSASDEAVAAQKQAEYDAQQAALQPAIDPANGSISRAASQTQTPVDEFTQFTQQVDADIENRKIAAGLKKPSEAIPATDILGDSNASDTTNAVTGLATDTGKPASGDIQGSMGNILSQPEQSGVGNATAAPTPSIGTDLPNGTGTSRNDAVEVSGKKLDKEWTAFNHETGTLGIPRNEMPQIKAEHRGAMVNFLNARDISHEQDTVPASSLKPTQQEFSENKVKKALGYEGGDRSILVSSDNHVLDGHHQWLAKLQNGENVDVIRLNAPIKELLTKVAEFPSAETAKGSNVDVKTEPSSNVDVNKTEIVNDKISQQTEQPSTTKPLVQPNKTKAAKSSSLLAALKRAGGIINSDKRDITGEDKKFAPGGYNTVFKNSARSSLKGHIESGTLDDYLPHNLRLSANGANDEAFDSTEAYDYLAERIRNGDHVLPYDVEQEAKANQYYQQDNATAQSDVDEAAFLLSEEEINEELRIADNAEREAATEAKQFVTGSEESNTGSSQRETAGSQTNGGLQPTPVTQTPNERPQGEREGVRPLVETIVKRRTAANQIGKQSLFDSALALAKDFLRGEAVSPLKFKNASIGFKNDTPLHDAFNSLYELAKPQAKESRAAKNSIVEDYKARIAKATKSIELRAIAGKIQHDKDLTDAQVEMLDGLVFDAQDKLTETKDNNAPDTTTTQGTQQPESNADLLGDNTKNKQAIADAERAKDAKRNSGEDNQGAFTLSGSNSEADQAAAAGAQDLFAPKAETKASETQQALESIKQDETIPTADKIKLAADLRNGNVTADDVSAIVGNSKPEQKTNVEDYGQKLEGARKDLVRAMAKEYSDDEIASLPLSKLWPATDINLIENKTAAAIAFAAREEIPSKPRKPYAVKVWVGKVKVLREIGRLVSKALESNPELMLQKIKDANLGHFKSKVALLEAIDRENWKRIGNVEEYPNAYRFEGETKVPNPLVRVDIDGRTNSFEASSVADVIDKVNEKLGVEQSDKRMAFEVRGRPGAYFINKKGDKNYTKLKEFKDTNALAAFDFIKNNYDEVLAAWEATKDRLNVKESDVRGKENKPRTGEDYRKGKNVSSEEFATTFGFRGVQFGEWVKQGGKDNDRQGALNSAYDALMDLANIIDVPPKALSLEGTLGLSFGARGHGKAAAHFEPGMLVINLTKTQGAGTLAHEFFHALDNYFSRKRGGEKSMADVSNSQQGYREANYITYKPEPLYVNKKYGGKGITKQELKRYQEQNSKSGYFADENWVIDPKHPEGVRPEVEERFADLVEALNVSPMKARAVSIDGVKEGADGYWSRIIERAARSFENYVINKMQLNGYENDYLANVVKIEAFNRDSSRFPYLLDEEIAPVAEAFDNLFSTIQTKETDNGNVAMFSRDGSVKSGLSKPSIQSAVNNLRNNWKNAPEIIVVDDMNDPAIRKAVRDENERQLSQGAQGQPEAFFDNGKVYIVAGEMNSVDDVVRVVFHETLGHYGLRGLYGKELGKVLDQVAMLRPREMKAKAKSYGLDLTKPSDKNIAAEEILAEMAQTAPNSSFVKRAIAIIRQFLRDIGVKLALTDNDIIVNYLIPARNYVVKGTQQEQGVRGLVAAFNRDNSPTTAQLFKELTLNDDMFKYPKSNATDMQDVFNEVAPGLVHIEKSKSFDDEVSELYSVYPIDAIGNPIRSKVGFINVYDDGKVEINVSSLGEGFGGSRIYAAVGNWAYNNGKVFAGDREGISPAGISRRLENMISLALKFGTTDHIMPHKNQMNDLEFDWKEGDSEYNLAEMLKASFNAIRNGVYVTTDNFGIELTEKSKDAKGVSKLDDLVYDFDKHQFTDVSNGKPYTTSDFDKLASTDEARATYAGRTTLQRAALGNTFMGATGKRKQLLLEQLSKLRFQHLQLTDPQLAGIFYSRSNQSQTDTPQFKAWFGDSLVTDNGNPMSEGGKPLVVYHGTGSDISIFDASKTATVEGVFFTPQIEYSNSFTSGRQGGGNIIPVFISMKNPRYIEADDYNFDSLHSALSHDENDGVIVKNTDGSIHVVVAIYPTQIKSAIGNNGYFSPTNPDIRFSRSNPAQQSLTPQWQSLPESKLGDNLIYALQDKHIDLKRVSQAIKQAGVDIADRWNTYLQEELFHGRSAKRTQDFIKHDLDPLIQDMRMRGVKMADFEEYLWARHAEERNIQIAKVNPEMQDGGSGMKTQEARDYLAKLSPADKSKYEALARRIDLINRKSRQVLLDYGLESADTIAAWEGSYKNYVPLMREDMDAGFGNGTGQGFSVKGNSSKRATGSNRAVVDIIANIAQQYEKNIIRGEKNRVSTALIGLAKLNPNKEFWQVDTPPMLKTVSKATGLVEERTDPNYKNRNNVIVARIPNKLGKIEERSVVFNEFDERAMRMASSLKNLDQDQIGELLGTASAITRYFSSVNTQYNPIFGIVNITRDVQGALLNLSTTPIADKKKEVLANTPKALKGIYQDLRSQRKNGVQADSEWARLFEEFQNEGGQTGYRDMFRNAKERGEALKNALDPTWWQNSKIGKVISLNGSIANQEQWIFDKAIKPIFQWLEDYNNALENAVRVSVYKVALDNGHSKQQAASMAKNISVNFNRKGEMARQIGSLYAFFNASAQGTARIAETLTTRDSDGKVSISRIGKRIVQGGLLLGAMQALALAAAGYDDDEPPEFIKDRNIVIPLDLFGADGKYITIPMPLGYNAIPSFGRILTEWALSGFDNSQERLVHVIDMLMDVTNPIGNAGLSLQTISPTVIDPIAALAENKDFTGRPIARQDFNSLDPTPGFTRAKDTASALAKGLAYGINALTGGTDFKPGAISPTPDQIDYLFGQVTGGVGREAMKVEQTATSIVTGEDLPTYKVPVVGRFYGDTKGQSSESSAFYNNLRELKMHENQIKGMAKAGEDTKQYRLDNPESVLITQANYTERVVQKLRKNRRALLEKDAPPAEIQRIDTRITELMHSLNEKVKIRKNE